MLTGPEIGYLGGIVGGVLGCVGGVVGTYCSIRNTNGPMERGFMIRVDAVMWVAVLLFIAMLMAFPRAYNMFMWIPYGIGCDLWQVPNEISYRINSIQYS